MTETLLPVAILAAPGFTETHFTTAQKALLGAGLTVKVTTPDGGLVQGWHEEAWGHHFMADADLADTVSTDYGGLLVPGGERGIEPLLENAHARRLVRAFVDAGRPVLLVGEAIGLLIVAEVANGRRVAVPASWHPRAIEAGLAPVDAPLVEDGTLLSTAGEDALDGALARLVELVRDRAVETRQAA